MLIHILTTTITVLGLLYIGLITYALVMADRLIFPDIPASYTDTDDILKLQSDDGETISAYYLEAKGSSTVMIYCHGNGEDLGHFREFMEAFRTAGISVFAFNYPGYGTSTGRASERGCYASSDAAYRYVTEVLGFEPSQICLYGRSLGGGPACWLAQRYPVGSMILDGTYTSTFRVMTTHRVLPWDKFDNLSRLRHDIRCPVLFIHGTEDLTIPFSHAERNYASYKGPKTSFWIEGAGHNDLYEIAGTRYRDTVLKFIDGNHQRKK